MKRATAALLALLVASCQAQRVEIVSRVADSHAAIARGEPDEGCTKLMGERVRDEARHHCEVRGRKAAFGAKTKVTHASRRCQVELTFWCTVP